MKIVDKIYNVNNGIWDINKNVIINKERSIINLGTKKVFKYHEDIKRCFYSNNYLFLLRDVDISILDENLNLLNRINQNGAVGISIFDKENYAIWFENEDEEEYFDLYSDAQFIARGDFFYGKFLNKDYCYRLKKRKDFQHFRLTDLLNTKTYFEHQCEEGYELVSDFYIWQETLIFMYFKDVDLILEQRDIKTGKIIWKTNIQDSSFIFDDERGIMVSIWGNSGKYSENKDQYQIIDLKRRTVEIGFPQKSFDFINVESHMGSALYKNKLYFSDNPFSYVNQEPNPIYVGCFDIESKKVDFIQVIPEMAGSQVAQIICNDDKLYVRSANGDLIVYEV
ncbi:hypothetical protein V3Q90_15120 [Flavobacterium oreochromis]|uniref:hypothetical protein n=1 Tax=Flavobacterium oreochromis TaxID=2906078 RepID=UPI003858E286